MAYGTFFLNFSCKLTLNIQICLKLISSPPEAQTGQLCQKCEPKHRYQKMKKTSTSELNFFTVHNNYGNFFSCDMRGSIMARYLFDVKRVTSDEDFNLVH